MQKLFAALSRFPRKRFQLPHSKISKKLKNALLKSLLWPNFDLNGFEYFASHSQKMASTSSIKILQKSKKGYFQTPTILVLEASNHFLRLLWPNFDLNHFCRFALLSHKMVSTLSLKICKKPKMSLSESSEHLFLISRSLQNHFLKSFLWPTLNLIGLEVSVLLSQKMVSTLLLTNLQKTEKCPFQTLRTFVLELKVPSKVFSNWEMNITNN